MSQEARKSWLALVSVSLLAFVSAMDFTITSTILPGIQRDLLASIGQLQWMINAYVMMATLFTVAMGRFGDIYGHRRILYLGAGLFAVATVLAGIAQTPGQLIAYRFLQGTAAAALTTASAALIPHIVPERHRGLALGVYTSIVGCGLASGPVIGGFLLSFLTWRWAFYMNIPVIMLAVAICWRSLEESPRQSDSRFDWLGLACLIVTVGPLVTALMEGEHWGWTSGTTLTLLLTAVVAGNLFVLVERRAAIPIIDFTLFRNRHFVISCVAVTALGGFVGLGSFLPPLYLQNVLNEEPYLVGLMLLSVSGLVVLLPPFVGRLGDRFGHKRFLFIGFIALLSAALVQATLDVASQTWFIVLGLSLFGVGWGVLQTTSSVMAVSALPVSASGLALGVLWTFWDLSSNLCLALGGLILETIDKTTLLAALAEHNINLQPYEHRTVRSLLSDPAQAHEILSASSPGLELKIFPLFQESFTAGYNGAMVFLAVMVGVCLVAVALLSRPTALSSPDVAQRL